MLSGCSIAFLSVCGGSDPKGKLRRVCATSQPVLVAAQNYAGLLVQPIWRANGITISGSCDRVSSVEGRTYAKFGWLAGGTNICQKPSLISSFAKRMGCPAGAIAIAKMILGSTQPSCAMESLGTDIVHKLLFTNGPC